MQAMPRSPAARSPDGLLNKTCCRPAPSSRSRIAFSGTSEGASRSTPPNPAFAAASNRSRSGRSANRKFRFAQNWSATSEVPLDLGAELLGERLGPELPTEVAGPGLRALNQLIDGLVDRLRAAAEVGQVAPGR